MTVAEAFGDLAETIARLDPATIAALKAPKAMNDRVSELVHKKKKAKLPLKKVLSWSVSWLWIFLSGWQRHRHGLIYPQHECIYF